MRTQTRHSIIDRMMFQRRVCGEGIDIALAPDLLWLRDPDETIDAFIRRVRREAREAGFASFEVRGRYNTDDDETPSVREAA